MKALLPILVIAAALGITALLIHFQPEANEVTPERSITSVEALTAQPEDIRLKIHSQGTVLPQTEVDLYAEVGGRIIEVADVFRTGGYFKKGQMLVQIDPVDYKAAVATRAADLATAELNLAQQEALSAQAAEDWKALGKGEASDLTLRKPQLTQAQAAVESARAQLAQAKRNLERAQIIAPFDGCILSKNADLGQYIAAAPASPIARIYATNQAEVRLPLTERDAGFLDPNPSKVVFNLQGQDSQAYWTGHINRIEGTIDPESRLVYAVAVLDQSLESTTIENPKLRRGLFVEAHIEGRLIHNAYSIPRYALRGSNTVYVITPDNTLVTREVEVIKSNFERVIIRKGIEPGERIATSPIAYFVENMPVTIIE